MKRILHGLILGGMTFGLIRWLLKTPAAADRFMFLLMGLYIAIGLLMLWKTPSYARPQSTSHPTDEVALSAPAKVEKTEPLSRAGYTFYVAVGFMLLLDLFIRY